MRPDRAWVRLESGRRLDLLQPAPEAAAAEPIERRVFDCSEIERSMAQLDLSIRQTKRVLDRLAGVRRRGAGTRLPMARPRRHLCSAP
jgi:hypothetical protein